jgi:hypothetical protein
MTVYRGITHVHSKYSFDGTMSLPEIRTLCRGAGYSFALMTEHIEGMSSDGFAAFLRECQEHSDETFLFVPGLEFHAECVSTNGINKPVDMGCDRRQLLEECLKQDTFNVFVHPRLLAERRRAALPDALHAVEVWNAKYDGARYPSPRNLALFHKFARERDCGAVVGVDLHTPTQLVPLHVSVELELLAPDSLLRALRAGRQRIGYGPALIEFPFPMMATLRMHAYAVSRSVASSSYRSIRRLLPAEVEKRLKTWINGRPYE